MLPVETPFKIYTGLTGQPLNNGYVYFGTANQNPITSPITVYWDAAGTQPAAQPLRTVNGYIVRAGTPANVFVGVSYSELVKDASGRQIFYARTSDDFSIGTAIINFLATLASSIGSTMIGFIAAGVGAVMRSMQSKVREVSVNVTDFMTEAERADGLTGAPVLDVTAAFLKAFAAANVVDIAEGTWLVGNLPINKNNFTLRGAGYNRCTLQATVATNITIEIATTNSVSFPVLEGFKLQGNATCLGGIKLGSSDAFYCAGAMLDQVGVWDYSRATGTNGYGIQLGCVQNLSIHNCWVYRNRHGYQRLSGTGYATSTRISGKTGYMGGGYIGMYIDSQVDDLYIDDNVIEGNNNSAIFVTANAVAAGRGSSIYINGAYFEANNATGAGVVYVTGSAAAYQRHTVVLDRCNFAINSGFYVTLDLTIGTIKNCKLAPGNVSTTANTDTNFENNRYSSAADYLTTYRALLGNVTVRDTNDPATGTTPNQINLVNAVTFPATARPVDDPYTLDDYRELTWTPVLSSDATPPTYTNLEAPEGTVIKIGGLVFVRCKMRVNITAAGTGTPKITGMLHAPQYGLEPPNFGLHTALNTTPAVGSSYIIAGPALLIGSTWKVIADSYIIFTVVYQAN